MTDYGVRRFSAALDTLPSPRDWPHAPLHRLGAQGAYMVTAGTYDKVHHFNSPERLDFALALIFKCAKQFNWLLQAWAVLPNHYHFVALSPAQPDNLRSMLQILHGALSRQLNLQDQAPGRKVMYQYWESHITYERSHLARLNYVHQNPVHHGIVDKASDYPWCSYAWFERVADSSFFKTVNSFKCDQIKVKDDF